MTSGAVVRIGTRESQLALAQARIAMEALAARGLAAQLVPISTRGDAISAQSQDAGWVEVDGQFTREIERALLDDRIDLAVHSYKDLPIAPVDGLVIGAVLERADARDCLVTADGGGIDDLPFGARVGTSSPRRAAQLGARRPDLTAVPIRGNVDTRLARLTRGDFDGVILAAAGLDRLSVSVPDHQRLPYDLVLPAPAQGALAIQLRAADEALLAAVREVDHAPTRIAVEAERSLLQWIGGGCFAPLGALGLVSGGELHLRAAFDAASGPIRRAEARGSAEVPDAVVARVAEQIARA